MGIHQSSLHLLKISFSSVFATYTGSGFSYSFIASSQSGCTSTFEEEIRMMEAAIATQQSQLTSCSVGITTSTTPSLTPAKD
jgi:hypothetical protein